MDEVCCFQPAQEEDLDAVFRLIDGRIRWMEEKGLHQWNETDYWGVYPPAHYRALMQRRELYVLRMGARITAAAALLTEDERWPQDGVRALYVHHLASQAGEKGAGALALDFCEAIARSRKMDYLRLDCAADNERLNRYYAQRGFLPAGDFTEGPYTGTRRQKRLAGCACCAKP